MGSIVGLLVCCFISILVNILLLWYIRSLFNRMARLPYELNHLKREVEKYNKYLSYLYSLETFYGEPIVQELVERTKSLSENINNSLNIFDIIIGEPEVEREQEDEERGSNEENKQNV